MLEYKQCNDELKALAAEKNAAKLMKMYKRELGLIKKSEAERQKNTKQIGKAQPKSVKKI